MRSCDQGESLAGEERDAVRLDGAAPVARAPLPADAVRLRGALLTSVLMAHALERICEMSIAYARERHQFGRPIGSFQAVQAHLVTIAQQTALVGVAADAAIERQGVFEIAAAKRLAASAAIAAARAAHQCTAPAGSREHIRWVWRPGACGPGGPNGAVTRRSGQQLGAPVAHAGAERLYPAIAGGLAGARGLSMALLEAL